MWCDAHLILAVVAVLGLSGLLWTRASAGTLTIALAWTIGLLWILACSAAAAAPDPPPPEPEPTLIDLLLAWAARAAIALIVGILGALGMVAAIRRIPWLQELVLPHADELDALGAAIEERVRSGRALSPQDARVAAGLAVRCGLTLLAALVFAGLLLQRL